MLRLFNILNDKYYALKQYIRLKQTKPEFNISREKILIFIGAPRSGTTLLGQLINYHPCCLIASESRVIQNVINLDKDFNNELSIAEKKAYLQYKSGLENDSHFSKTLDQYQKQWKSIGNLSSNEDFIKKNVSIVGDKKSGGTVQAYIDQKQKMLNLLESHPEIHLLQIVRNPIDAALSYLKSHPHEVSSFEEACEKIIKKTCYAFDIRNNIKNKYLNLYYEDLLKQPEQEIKKICEWLELDFSDSWLKEVSSIVNKSSKQKIYSNQELQIIEKIMTKYDFCDLLKKYVS